MGEEAAQAQFTCPWQHLMLAVLLLMESQLDRFVKQEHFIKIYKTPQA